MANDDLLIRAANGENYRLACTDLGGNLRRLTVSGAGSSSWPDGLPATPGAFFTAQPTTGLYRLSDGTLGFSVAGLTALQLLPTAVAVNYLNVLPTISGQRPGLQARGTDTNVGMSFSMQGTGDVLFTNSLYAAVMLRIQATASAVNYPFTKAGVTGSLGAVSFGADANSSDANVGVALVTKGSGALSAQVPDSTTAGGNARGTNAVDWQQSRAAAAQVANGTSAVISGGANNTADGSNSWVPGGTSGSAKGRHSVGVWSGANIASVGDAQSVEAGARKQTTDATATRLTANNSGLLGITNTFNLPDFSAYTGRLLVVGKQVGGTAVAAWNIDVGLLRGSGVGTVVMYQGSGAAIVPTASNGTGSAWRLDLAADTTNGGMSVTVTGAAATTINWNARLMAAEIVTAS